MYANAGFDWRNMPKPTTKPRKSGTDTAGSPRPDQTVNDTSAHHIIHIDESETTLVPSLTGDAVATPEKQKVSVREGECARNLRSEVQKDQAVPGGGIERGM